MRLPKTHDLDEPPEKNITAPLNETATLRILVVDDEPLVARALKRSLKTHHVEIVSKGADALKRFRTHSHDIIFCDVMMPEMNGPQLLGFTKDLYPELARRIIFMSGVFQNEIAALLAKEPNLVIEKPFVIQKLWTPSPLWFKRFHKRPVKSKTETRQTMYNLVQCQHWGHNELRFRHQHWTCIGCHACSTACKSENQAHCKCQQTWVKYTETGTYPDAKRHFQVTRCNHCANPPCVRSCPTSAMYQRDDGIVEFNSDHCIAARHVFRPALMMRFI